MAVINLQLSIHNRKQAEKWAQEATERNQVAKILITKSENGQEISAIGETLGSMDETIEILENLAKAIRHNEKNRIKGVN